MTAPSPKEDLKRTTATVQAPRQAFEAATGSVRPSTTAVDGSTATPPQPQTNQPPMATVHTKSVLPPRVAALRAGLSLWTARTVLRATSLLQTGGPQSATGVRGVVRLAKTGL